MSDEPVLAKNIQAFRELIKQKEWKIISENEIQSGYEFRVTDGHDKIPVRFYTTGKALIQGKIGNLQSQIQTWWQNISVAMLPNNTAQNHGMSVAQHRVLGIARIGLDESGKGDYFGPLVIGAV